MTSGGKRKGAGRPKIKDRGKPVQFYLKPATLKRLADYARSEFHGNKSASLTALITSSGQRRMQVPVDLRA